MSEGGRETVYNPPCPSLTVAPGSTQGPLQSLLFTFFNCFFVPNMASIASLTLGALLLGAQVALAIPSDATTKACNEIKKALPGKVVAPGLLSVEYLHETQQYWATNLRDVKPACIVQPNSAQDVSIVVKTLNKYPTVRFATRSGGHDPNQGHATIQDGVLITMTDMVGATYDAAEDVAYVRPGGEWNDVIGDLEKSGVAISGGRLGRAKHAL